MVVNLPTETDYVGSEQRIPQMVVALVSVTADVRKTGSFGCRPGVRTMVKVVVSGFSFRPMYDRHSVATV